MLILGSASVRRKELLAQIGVVPDLVLPPEIDEQPLAREMPRAYVERIARAKLAAVLASVLASVLAGPGDLVLCADTTVALGRRILGKPVDEAEAARFLTLLGGRRHQVITAVAVRCGDRQWFRTVVSDVKFKRLSDEEMRLYLVSGEWHGKAGAYAIQGRAGAFVTWLQGSFTGIVGLPLAETAGMLRAAGYPVGDLP